MKTKRVYSFDPRTRVFAGYEVAHESPLEPGEWLVPAHSTEVEPPQIPAGWMCRWNGSAWMLECRVDPDRTARDARRDAGRRISEFTDAMIEACYARERVLRDYLRDMPDDIDALDDFEPALWSA